MNPGDEVLGTPVGSMAKEFPTVQGTYWAKTVQNHLGDTWVSDGILVPDKGYVVECTDIRPIHQRRKKP